MLILDIHLKIFLWRNVINLKYEYFSVSVENEPSSLVDAHNKGIDVISNHEADFIVEHLITTLLGIRQTPESQRLLRNNDTCNLDKFLLYCENYPTRSSIRVCGPNTKFSKSVPLPSDSRFHSSYHGTKALDYFCQWELYSIPSWGCFSFHKRHTLSYICQALSDSLTVHSILSQDSSFFHFISSKIIVLATAPCALSTYAFSVPDQRVTWIHHSLNVLDLSGACF